MQRYINTTRGTSSVQIQRYLRIHLWWSLCTLYLPACQVRVTVGDSGLCCCDCYDVFWVLINSLVGWFCRSALGLVPFQICASFYAYMSTDLTNTHRCMKQFYSERRRPYSHIPLIHTLSSFHAHVYHFIPYLQLVRWHLKTAPIIAFIVCSAAKQKSYPHK